MELDWSKFVLIPSCCCQPSPVFCHWTPLPTDLPGCLPARPNKSISNISTQTKLAKLKLCRRQPTLTPLTSPDSHRAPLPFSQSHSSEDLVGIESSGLRAELLLLEQEAALEAGEVWRLGRAGECLPHSTLLILHTDPGE